VEGGWLDYDDYGGKGGLRELDLRNLTKILFFKEKN